MLERACSRLPQASFVAADMTSLPFADAAFDKTVSTTALEFIEDGKQALVELFRVTRPGGTVVVATLNSLSPWVAQRKAKAEVDKGSLFNQVWFRSPEELQALAPVSGKAYSAVHFGKDCTPSLAIDIEQQGQAKQLDTGAF